MSVLSVYGGSISITGINFGDLVLIPVVIIHGEQCSDCQVQEGDLIVCDFCEGGPSKIYHELVVSVDGLDSDIFLFRYKGT